MKLIIFSLLFISNVLYSYTQNVECIGNTIEIPLTGYKNGVIQWEFSTDERLWSSIKDANTVKLTYTIVESGYFRAKVTSGDCDFFSDVTYIKAVEGTQSNAGDDKFFTDGTKTLLLNANTPSDGEGNWVIKSGSGGEFSDTKNPKANFTGALGSNYVLSWTIASECLSSSDDVRVNFYNPDHFVTDIDGNFYHTVNINSREWMAENLKSTRYNNGELIGTTIPANLDISSSANLNFQWAYAGNESNIDHYGRLYTWNAATDARTVCPSGWILPSDDDWIALADALGGLEAAGGKLKETGTSHWMSPNVNATNESGFSALPGGNRSTSGNFSLLGTVGGWWSSSEKDWEQGHDFYIYNTNSSLYGGSYYKTYGVSIRCIKQ